MSNIWLLVFLAVVVVISLIWTLIIFKQEENKLKKYEQEGETGEEELRRAEEYEQDSLKRQMPRLIWIYVITIVLSLIVFGIYLF